MSVDENNAYRIAERLSFPRLIGTEGEKRAIEVVIDEFKKAGYEKIYREKFKTSFFNWTASRILFLPLGGLLILTVISFFFNPLVSLILILVFMLSSIKTFGIIASTEIRLMKNEAKNYETENIYVKLKNNNSKVKIVFLAHYDSKSQTFSSKFRIMIFIVSIFGSFMMATLILILSVLNIFIPFRINLLNFILLLICIFLGTIGALNLFNKTGNKSPGAYDNAAAVGTIIELARYFKKNSLENIDLICLCTSSEELNLGGAKDFIKVHKKEFDKKSTYFINFDLIGGNELIKVITSYGIPKRISSEKLSNLFLSCANDLNIKANNSYLPMGAWSDFMPIVQNGFEACWVASLPGLKKVHTPKDDLSLITKEGLRNCLFLSIEVVKRLNEELNLEIAYS